MFVYKNPMYICNMNPENKELKFSMNFKMDLQIIVKCQDDRRGSDWRSLITALYAGCIFHKVHFIGYLGFCTKIIAY